ncbi:MAG: alpha/beta hydrolase [Bacillota bacterium]
MQFRLKRETWDYNTSIPLFREKCEKFAKAIAKVPEWIEVEPVTVAGLPGEWIMPSKGSKKKVIFYTHGGAFVSGSCLDHRMHVAKFVKGAGIAALLFEYRLARNTLIRLGLRIHWPPTAGC